MVAVDAETGREQDKQKKKLTSVVYGKKLNEPPNVGGVH